MKLLDIQEKVVSLLESAPYFSGRRLPVIAEDRGDVLKRLDAAIARAKKCILVQTPGFKITSSASKVMVGVVSLVVQCIERLPTGRQGDGATAQDMAEVVAWTLNLQPVDGAGVLVARSIQGEELDDTTLSYAVVFEVEAALGDPT